MYILEDLYAGNLRPSECCFTKHSKYGELLDLIIKQQNIFCSELSPMGKKAYAQYVSHQNELSAISDCEMFIKGFRCGARMILDVVGEYHPELAQLEP